MSKKGLMSFLYFALFIFVPGSFLARADSVLNFPLLSFEQNSLVGTAFVNPSDSDATVTVTAYGRDGSLLSGAGFVNPSPTLTVPARQRRGCRVLAVIKSHIGLGRGPRCR
jgi:hypothetical protein